MSETTLLAIAKEYPQDKYNLLIPVRTMQEISPLHKLIINEVQIESNPLAKDVYKEKNGEYALTKKGLMKLMAAANIQILKSEPVPTQRCNKCIEIAQRTRQAPKCFECPYIDDVAHQVTIAVPEPSGTTRIVKATKEIRMEDVKANMSDAQFKQFKQFKTEHCESKALNRALREGLMIKSSYKAEELKKPFVVALVMPNISDPDLKKAMIERYANNANILYGTDIPQIEGYSQPQALPQTETIIIDDDNDIIDYETGEIIDTEIIEPQVEPKEQPTALICSNCQEEIKGFTDKHNKKWTAEKLAEYTALNLGKQLCQKCLIETLEKAKAGGKKND